DGIRDRNVTGVQTCALPICTPDGRGMRQALAFMYPFIKDKRTWPKPPDVMYYDQWPVRHPALLFGGVALHEPRYVDLWKTLDPEIGRASCRERVSRAVRDAY